MPSLKWNGDSLLETVSTGVVGPIATWTRSGTVARSWQVRLNAAGGFEIFDGTAAAVRLSVDVNGYVAIASRFAFNGKTPIANVAAPAAATILADTITLVNDIRTRLINLGVYT